MNFIKISCENLIKNSSLHILNQFIGKFLPLILLCCEHILNFTQIHIGLMVIPVICKI